MSGCQRLCPTCFWSVNFFVLSSGNRFFGMSQLLHLIVDDLGGYGDALACPRGARAREVLLGRRDVLDLDRLEHVTMPP